MKVNNLKKRKSEKKTGLTPTISKNQTSANPQWKKVKLSGNLLSMDDGGAGLEGLLGLEILENYGDTITVTKGKQVRRKKTSSVKKENNDDSDDDQPRCSKNELKKKKRKLKESKEKKKLKESSAIVHHPPGRFVRPITNCNDAGDDSINTIESSNHSIERKDDLKNSNNQKQYHDRSNQTVLTTDDLIGWNGFGIDESILRVLAEKGFKEPTEIQAQTFPAAIMGRRDILGAAETGSGKTLAFGIPIVNAILEMKKHPGKLSHFRKIDKKNEMAEAEVDKDKLDVNLIKNNKASKRKRDDRDNFTPPPEEINNFPDSFIQKGLYEMNRPRVESENSKAKSKPLYALILTPTRELAVQVKDHLVAITKYNDIRVAAIFGGLAVVKQERVLSKCPEIVVATPGRLWELLNEGNEHLNKLPEINFLVVDETDRMIEKGHFEELKLILDRLNANRLLKAQRQNFIFSATLTLIHELPNYLKLKNMNKKHKQFEPENVQQKLDALIQYFDISQPKIIDITQTESSVGKGSGIATKLTECRISCSHDQKDLYLYYFLQKHPGRTIVFCNSIDCVRRLAKLFKILECSPVALHAKMAQRARLKSLESFTTNPTGLLIATDVAARGLDIPNVEHVIHYQVPRTSENYIHRSGRTARGNKEGITVLFMEPKEVNEYVKLCRTLKRNEDLPTFPVSERYLAAVRERVSLARKIDVEELRARRQNADIGWLKKSAKEMDILIDDKNDFSDSDHHNSSEDEAGGGARQIKARRDLRHMKGALKNLLAKPVFPKGFSYKYPSAELIDNEFNERSNQNAVKVMKNAIETANKKQKLTY
ncbi:ATP-dependent RNA helicase DDX24 [Sitodiplosis mosellana]|uniref:ATP-dependent RNA helicase DDX24 n=1 Tax=Sitodiplosis mosellana TaxID=263140 RepID=UPI00244472A8|nr:ATP-dependent RNA helicase DDX24 [Sitodiplosis mosellana]